jgi:hypothetical protein
MVSCWAQKRKIIVNQRPQHFVVARFDGVVKAINNLFHYSPQKFLMLGMTVLAHQQDIYLTEVPVPYKRVALLGSLIRAT